MKVSEWGNSLGIRLPRDLTVQVGLKAGDVLEYSVGRDGSLTLRPARVRYDLKELVARITPENRPEAVDWGGPAGREEW